MKRSTVSHEFVEFIPATPEEGILYISIPYGTAIHMCACGCGNKVVTPISPAEWHLEPLRVLCRPFGLSLGLLA